MTFQICYYPARSRRGRGEDYGPSTLGKTNRIEHAARMQRLFTDTAESVQAAAIAAYGALLGEPAMRVVRHSLSINLPRYGLLR